MFAVSSNNTACAYTGHLKFNFLTTVLQLNRDGTYSVFWNEKFWLGHWIFVFCDIAVFATCKRHSRLCITVIFLWLWVSFGVRNTAVHLSLTDTLPDQEFRWDLQELSVNVPGVCSFRGDDGHGFWITFLVLLWDVVSPTSLRAWPQLHSLYGVCLNKRESKLQRDKGQSIIECFWQLPNLKGKNIHIIYKIYKRWVY